MTQLLDGLPLDRRCRTTPRAVGRTISDYARTPPAGSSAAQPPGHRAIIKIDVLPTHH